jgi:hypothetical protein
MGDLPKGSWAICRYNCERSAATYLGDMPETDQPQFRPPPRYPPAQATRIGS